MNTNLILQLVHDLIAKNPAITREIIDAATEGVKTFADSQRDDASKLAFMMCEILDKSPVDSVKFGAFSAKEVVERIAPWFEGTEGLKKLRKKWRAEA